MLPMNANILLKALTLLMVTLPLRAASPDAIADIVYYEDATSSASNGIPHRHIHKIVLRRDGSAETLYWFGGGREYLYSSMNDDRFTFTYTKLDVNSGKLIFSGHSRTLTFGSSGASGRWTDGIMEGIFTISPISLSAPLLNLSLRTTISPLRPGIAGFILRGNRDVLVRIVGPGLESFGVGGFASNPKLAVYSGERLVAENLDWENQHPGIGPPKESLLRIFGLCGAFPLANGSKDAAIMLRLPDGNYTIHASTESQSREGEALIEVYLIP